MASQVNSRFARTIQFQRKSTMTAPMIDPRIPPQSRMTSSPMPCPLAKISQPTIAPTIPTMTEISHDFGPWYRR
jgi:hypothetical protein